MINLFLLCVDRDGDPNRRTRLDYLEDQAKDLLKPGCLFLAENAWQELEVWALAGHKLPASWSWRSLRSEPDPKESYFRPFAEQRGLLDEPGEGRQTLAREAAQNYGRLRQLCPEDIGRLEERIGAWLNRPG
jgi:hypothetical protein